MLSAVLRDADAMPIIRELQAGRLAYLADVEVGVAVGRGAHGRTAERVRDDGLAHDFLAWRTLKERGLSRTDAIAVMSSAVRAAAVSGRPTDDGPASTSAG
jgi:hypothetical protein